MKTMVNQISTDDVFFVSSSQTTGIKKIDPVKEVNSLPDHGKELPVTEKKTQPREEDVDQAVRELNENSQVVQRALRRQSASTSPSGWSAHLWGCPPRSGRDDPSLRCGTPDESPSGSRRPT